MKIKSTFKLMLLLLFMGAMSIQLQAQNCQANFTFTVDTNGVGVFNSTSTAQGGIGSYNWAFGSGVNYYTAAATHQFTTSGVFVVCLYISDFNQTCVDSICQQVVVNMPAACTMQAVVSYSLPNFSFIAQPTGGVAPFTYLWMNGATSQTIMADSLTSTYCVTITDAQGCTATDCEVINPNCNLVATIVTDSLNSSLTAVALMGTAPFSYSWSNGSSQTQIYPDSSATYCVGITDALGCTSSECYSYSVCPFPVYLNAVVNSSGDAATVYWDAAGFFTNFEYALTTTSTPPNSGTVTNSLSTTLSGLTPNTSYCVHVRTYCSNSSSYTAWQTYCFVTTPNCNTVFTYTQTMPGTYVFISNANVTETTIWNFGDGSPIDTIVGNQITHTFTSTASYMACMTVVGCSQYCAPIYVQGSPTSVICGNVFNDFDGNSVIDPLDTGIDSVYLFIYGSGMQQSIFTDANGNYSVSVPAGNYTINMCVGGANLANGIITVPAASNDSMLTNCPSYQITIGANDTICGNNFGFFNNASTISGYLFFDANSNGIMDAGELPIANQMIMIGVFYTYTNSNGYYSLMVPMGLYDIVYTPTNFYSTGTITTTAITVNVTQNGISYGNNNIGLYMAPGQVDLGITIHPSTTVTPGFGAWYSVSVCNYGATPTGATVLMQYDPVLTPNYQSPAANLVNTTNQLLTWNIASINPGACVSLWVTFNALVGTPLGQSTMEFVSVSPTTGIDNNFNNNTDTIHQIVVGSWDPNNKLVDYTNLNDPSTLLVSGIDPNQEIRYTINFQNTGNAPAHNVVVVDEMSTNLDINSYQFVGSSHACDIMRNGTTTNYKFMNIMLPDSTNDEPNSHGYVSFKVNAIAGLNIGEQIIDYSNIYFDFNAAVSTNDAIVTLVGMTGAPRISENDLTVYPNPANEYVSINLNTTLDGTALISIFDLSGKLAMQQERELKSGFNKLIVNTTTLDKGMYVMQLTQANGKRIHAKLSIK